MGEMLNNSAIIKKFNDFLEAGHYRKTPERFAILDRVLTFPRAFTIDDLALKLDSILFAQIRPSQRCDSDQISYLKSSQTSTLHVIRTTWTQSVEMGGYDCLCPPCISHQGPMSSVVRMTGPSLVMAMVFS